MGSRARAAAGELSAAALQTLRRQCDRRSGCGRCPACRAVLTVARRTPAPETPAAPADEVVAAPEAPTEMAPAPDPQPEAPDRPGVRDSKAAWVEYAVTQGMDRDEAEATSKPDLMAALA